MQPTVSGLGLPFVDRHREGIDAKAEGEARWPSYFTKGKVFAGSGESLMLASPRGEANMTDGRTAQPRADTTGKPV